MFWIVAVVTDSNILAEIFRKINRVEQFQWILAFGWQEWEKRCPMYFVARPVRRDRSESQTRRRSYEYHVEEVFYNASS